MKFINIKEKQQLMQLLSEMANYLLHNTFSPKELKPN